MHDNIQDLRLSMRGIEKAFGGARVLRNVDLDLRKGEVLALLGANGAGKSTLMKILVGAYSRDAGSIEIDGKPVLIRTPLTAMAAGIRLLPQEISIIPEMTVAENIYIGELPYDRRLGLRHLDKARMREGSRQLLGQLGLGLAPDRRAKTLVASEQRIVEVARALAGHAKVLVMDEPTAALTEHEVEFLFRIIRKLTQTGVSVIYISHHLDEVFDIADRIQVLRDGRSAGVFDKKHVSRSEVLEAMLGRTVSNLYPAPASQAGPPVLEVRDLTVAGSLDKVSFEIRRGEIVGVFGLIGSGIETVGKVLFGASRLAWTGTLTMDGAEFRPGSPRQAIGRDIGFVAAERATQGILPDMTVQENLTLPYVGDFAGALGIDHGKEARHSERWIGRLGVRAKGSRQRLRYLSGGNQQKICLARWFYKDMRLIILEEPTRGVDVGARRDLYAELRRCAEAGSAVLVISSDVEEVAGLCDRMIALDRGQVVAERRHGATAGELMGLAAEAREITA